MRQTSRVLIVDDDAGVRRMLERTLEAEGYEVTLAADGGARWSRSSARAPDLIVLDVTMPGVGRARRDAAAARARATRVPVLLLTARDAIADRVAGLDAGADDYLVKPFATEELLARVRALLRRGRAAGDLLSAGDLALDPRGARARRAAGATSSLTRVRPSCSSCCCATRAPSSRASRRSTRCGARAAWPPNAVDRYVAYLRRKLGDPPVIRTVRGVGFVLEP